MKSNPLNHLASFATILLLASLGNGLADLTPQPVLDITLTSSGEIKDVSGNERDLQLRYDQIGITEDQKAIELKGADAITIPYQENDPLFGIQEFTWIVKCRFLSSANVSVNHHLFGRWDAMHDKRVSALTMDSSNGGILFMLSSDGTAEGTSGILSQPPPENEWFYMVAQYLPGTVMKLSFYGEDGALLDQEYIRQGAAVPTPARQVDASFVVGAPLSAGLMISRFRAWNQELTREQIQDALEK